MSTGFPNIEPDQSSVAAPVPEGARPDQDTSPIALTVDDDALLAALLSRGKKKRVSIELSDDDATDLINRVIRDFNDGAAGLSEWYLNQVELVKNWEGIVDAKTFPYEDAANVRVPFTSVQIQQWAARIVKALLGGEYVTRFEALDESIDAAGLDETNMWFQWELDEIVDLREQLERVIQQVLIGGVCLPIPCWKKERRELLEYREFDFDETKPLMSQLQAAIEIMFDGKDAQIVAQTGQGIFTLEVKDPDEDSPDKAKVTFCIRNGRLCANVSKIETTFNGVKIVIPQSEDLVFINTHPELEKLPFMGLRLWENIADYRDGLANGTWYNLGDERNDRVLATATNKIQEVVPMDYTTLQDEEEGTDSRDTQAVNYERRFIEIYRWEGWIHPKRKEGEDEQDVALSPAVQVAVWVVPRAREIIRIERLEALNKDGKRSPVKFGFIERPGRFLPISLSEWLRHVQAELDGIHNLRLDSGTLSVMPFGFYKPLAGLQKDVYKIQPGSMYPTADPSSVSFPQTNARPQWSFQDEALVYKYGSAQSGLNESSTGSFVSKRQSASEYLGTANAIDLRTEAVVVGFLRSLRRLLYRIVGLYQQFAPPSRIFQVGGAEGVKLVKRFETDRLQGKLLLRLTGNLDQINPQLQRDIAMNMLSLLMNQILIQLGIVKPDTIYAAISHVAKAMNYKGVPLHKPDLPEQSPSPNIENKLMVEGTAVQPHLDENFDEHLRSHMGFLTDPNAKKMLNQKSLMLMMQHIQQTQKMQQIAAFLRQQESLMATNMSKQMTAMGIRPGLDGGQQVGDNAEGGSKDEGVDAAAA
jgi:hypothetical protein